MPHSVGAQRRFPTRPGLCGIFLGVPAECLARWVEAARRLERWETSRYPVDSEVSLWLPNSPEFYLDFGKRCLLPQSDVGVDFTYHVCARADGTYQISWGGWSGVSSPELLGAYVLFAVRCYEAAVAEKTG